jgi:hypothetical protein
MILVSLSGSGAVHGHPDLRLEAAAGDRFELNQKHIVKLHESLADFPLLVDGPIHRV